MTLLIAIWKISHVKRTLSRLYSLCNLGNSKWDKVLGHNTQQGYWGISKFVPCKGQSLTKEKYPDYSFFCFLFFLWIRSTNVHLMTYISLDNLACHKNVALH